MTPERQLLIKLVQALDHRGCIDDAETELAAAREAVKAWKAQAIGHDERSRVIRILREICGTFGDNDWPDNLDLGDVLEKHLQPWMEGLEELEEAGEPNEEPTAVPVVDWDLERCRKLLEAKQFIVISPDDKADWVAHRMLRRERMPG